MREGTKMSAIAAAAAQLESDEGPTCAAIHLLRRAVAADATSEAVPAALATLAEQAPRFGDEAACVALKTVDRLAARGVAPAPLASVARAAVAAMRDPPPPKLLAVLRQATSAPLIAGAAKAAPPRVLVVLPAPASKVARRALGHAWVAALKKPITPKSVRLAALRKCGAMLGAIPEPLRLADAFVAALAAADEVEACSALRGVFTLVTRHGLDAPDFVDRLVALTTARTLREAPADLLGVAAPVLGASRLPDLQRAALAAALIDAATTAPPAAARRALSAVSDAARTQGVCREALTAPAAKAFGSHWAPPLRDVDEADEAGAADASYYGAFMDAAPDFAPPPINPTAATRKRPLFDADDARPLRRRGAVFSLEKR